MITCKCPAAASLESIPAVTCTESFGQIQKVAFQRLTGATGLESIDKKATWTPLLTAADDKKVVVSPYIQAPTSEPGAARTFGGGNETLGGIEIVIGSEPTAFTGVLRGIPQSVIKAMKSLQCEATSKNLGVYMFDEAGRIECLEKDGKYYPIPIQAFFVSDKGHGGYDAIDSNNIQWSFAPNYSDDLVIVTPSDFNPLTDLV